MPFDFWKTVGASREQECRFLKLVGGLGSKLIILEINLDGPLELGVVLLLEHAVHRHAVLLEDPFDGFIGDRPVEIVDFDRRGPLGSVRLSRVKST